VKPANVLVTRDGLAKVADFGLTAARARLAEAADTSEPASSVTTRCGSPHYNSPEQAEGAKVHRATDVWSWGLSVLEMFTGDVASRPGVVAPWALDQFLKTTHQTTALPQMPQALADVLRKCFCLRPEDRWASMDEAADHLVKIYRECTGHEYPRMKPPAPLPPAHSHASPDRWTNWGYQWDDPRDYLEDAIADEGIGNAAAIVGQLAAAAAASRSSQALVDIALYEETLERYRRMVKGGRHDLKMRLYRICTEKAAVHAYLGDMSGAQALFNEALSVVHSITPQSASARTEIARVYINKGLTFYDAGEPEAALGEQARASQVLTSLISGECRLEWCNELAKVYLNMGNALHQLNRYPDSVEMYLYANELREWLLVEQQMWEVAGELAESYRNLSGTMLAGKMAKEAKDLCGRAMAMLSYVRESGPAPRIDSALAWACVTMAQASSQLSEHTEAVKWCERGIAELDQLHRIQDRPEARVPFAQAIAARAQIAEAAGDRKGAIQWWQRAIDLHSWLVFEAGQHELEEALANAIASYERVAEHPWKRFIRRFIRRFWRS